MTTIPTIKQLYDGILSNLEGEFSISINPFGHAFLVALAGVMAGCLWLIYLGIAKLQKNIWFDTCDYATLVRFGVIIIRRYPYNATNGQYTVSVTGTIGATIPATTVYKSDDSSESPGKLYRISSVHVMVGATDNITINALEGGADSALVVGNTLTATAPILNVGSAAIVTVENVAPENAEDMEEYRDKIRDRVQATPGSWNAVDYRLVGGGVTGVGETYAYGASATEVDVWIQGVTPVADPGPSASPTVITAYETALDLVRPLPDFIVNVASCPIKNVDITIVMGTFPTFTLAQKALIESALEQFVNSVHPFIAAADVAADRNDKIATFNLIGVISAAVPGSGFSGVTFEVDGAAVTVYEFDNGEIPFYNSITYA